MPAMDHAVFSGQCYMGVDGVLTVYKSYITDKGGDFSVRIQGGYFEHFLRFIIPAEFHGFGVPDGGEMGTPDIVLVGKLLEPGQDFVARGEDDGIGLGRAVSADEFYFDARGAAGLRGPGGGDILLGAGCVEK